MKGEKFYEKLKQTGDLNEDVGLYQVLNARNLSQQQIDYLIEFLMERNDNRCIRTLIDNPYVYLQDHHYCSILTHIISKGNDNEYFTYTYSTLFTCVMRIKNISELLEMYSFLNIHLQRSNIGIYVFQKIMLKINRFYSKKRSYY